MKALQGARTDLIIATVALLVSAGATISSVYQTKVVANQLSASVWPYLSIETNLSENAFALSVSNDGLGPALVRSAKLSVDGKPYPTYRGALAAIFRGTTAPTPKGSFASIDATSVIHVADQRVLMKATLGPSARTLGDLGKRVALELCYCSLLDQCWNVRSGTGKPRVAVPSCASNDGIDY